MICRHSLPFTEPTRSGASWSRTSDSKILSRVYVRHGLASSQKPFEELCKYLGKDNVGRVLIDNSSYCWRCPVIVNGLRLAEQIVNDSTDEPTRVALIGHSMGGLVARVAHLALMSPQEFNDVLDKSASTVWLPRSSDLVDVRRESKVLRDSLQNRNITVGCLITLATPNSGAMANFEIANLMNLAIPTLFPGASAVGKVAAKLTAPLIKTIFDHSLDFQAPSIQDLTSSRLFRFFQEFATEPLPTPFSSISGSAVSKLSSGGLTGGAINAGLTFVGLHNDRPHDLVVEDESVDLCRSCLPNEVIGDDPTSKPTNYTHHRLYKDCIDINHSTIYKAEAALKLIRRIVEHWLGSFSEVPEAI